TLINDDQNKNKSDEMRSTFSTKVRGKGHFSFIDFDFLLDEKNGFFKDDRVVIESKFIVEKVVGIQQPLEFDFSIPGVGSDDIILIIEEKKVHVSKNYLAMHSPYFAAMFFQEFKEKEK
ncbi:hypothetical protein PFISCL1PPCAC_20930, partial [Pristionchus fissidentatus]